jgi:hypothetical protein
VKVNFKIITSTEIAYDSRHIDLHNNFDFVAFDYNFPQRKLSVHLKKSNGDWVQEDELENIVFIHRDVSFININFNNPLDSIKDDSTLEFISYFPKSDRNTNDSFINQEYPNEDDILFSFVNQQFIRVDCKQVELITF